MPPGSAESARLTKALSDQCDRWITPDPWGGFSPDVHRIVEIISPEIARWKGLAEQLGNALETTPADDCAQNPHVQPCQICAALAAWRAARIDGSGVA